MTHFFALFIVFLLNVSGLFGQMHFVPTLLPSVSPAGQLEAKSCWTLQEGQRDVGTSLLPR